MRVPSDWVVGRSEEKLAEQADEISTNVEKKQNILYFIVTFIKIIILYTDHD